MTASTISAALAGLLAMTFATNVHAQEETTTPPPPPAADVTITPDAAPVSSPSSPGEMAASDAEAMQTAVFAVQTLSSEVAHRISRARLIYQSKPMTSDLKPEIGRALDRAVDQVQTQMLRIEKAAATPKPGAGVDLESLEDEISAMVGIADVAGDRIANVRTKGGDTEDTLQDIASEIREISERAESAAEDVERAIERAQDGEGTAGVVVGEGKNGEKVSFGGPTTVEAGETVQDAVAFFGPLTVVGNVDGDAVAVVGNITVTSTGRVRGDAVAVGGRVKVEEGGRVDGEITNVGGGAVIAALASGNEPLRERRMSAPARFGRKMIYASMFFVVFFLLGLLAITLAPTHTEVVADALTKHPFKSGGLGVLLGGLVLPLLCALLLVTLIGILPLVFVVIPCALLGVFLGYVALATAIGRRLPTNVDPTRTAVLAIGSVVLVVIWMVPYFGGLFLFFAGFFGFGAVLMTRFGQQPANGVPPTPPPPQQDLTTAA